MGWFSSLVPAHRRGVRNFERAREAERRGDFERAAMYFEKAADGFDVHFAGTAKPRPSYLVMAGISYTRLGRNEDAIRSLDKALEAREIPDAFLHAGYAAAKEGDRDRALSYWERYPDWADQVHISRALKEQKDFLGAGGDLQAACEAVAKAAHKQDKLNYTTGMTIRNQQTNAPRRKY